MSLLIETKRVPVRDRLEFWENAMADNYHSCRVESSPEEKFWAQMDCYQLGAIEMIRLSASAAKMTRTARAVAVLDPEVLMFTVNVRGWHQIRQQGRDVTIQPGDITMYDSSYPVRAYTDKPFEVVNVRIPKRVLGRRADRVRKLAVTRIPPSHRLGRIVGALCKDIAQGLSDGSVPERQHHVAESVLELILSLYTDPSGTASATTVAAQSETLTDARSFIHANLADPTLDPETVAQATFVSTRQLHRLFESDGATVCGWIRAERLDRCRRDLGDPSLREETITEIASRWGLTDPAHFSKIFRVAYGCSPRQFRYAAVPGVSPEARRPPSIDTPR